MAGRMGNQLRTKGSLTMGIVALILAIAAVLGFGFAAARPKYAITAISISLALLTAAWIFQTTILSGPHIHTGL